MVVEIKLLTTYIRGGVASAMPELAHHDDDTPDEDGRGGSQRETDVLAFAY